MSPSDSGALCAGMMFGILRCANACAVSSESGALRSAGGRRNHRAEARIDELPISSGVYEKDSDFRDSSLTDNGKSDSLEKFAPKRLTCSKYPEKPSAIKFEGTLISQSGTRSQGLAQARILKDL